MTNPQLARLHEYLAKLKLVTIQARLETFLREASAQEVTYADCSPEAAGARPRATSLGSL